MNATNHEGVRGRYKRALNPLVTRVYHIICAHPEGISRKEICHELDIASHRLGQLLTSLEGTNMLVSEERGMLYPAYF